MNTRRFSTICNTIGFLLTLGLLAGTASAQTPESGRMLYDPGPLKAVDSQLKVTVGDPAPPVSLPALTGETVTLEQFRGKRNVVISFVPAAWTPVCSDQWPGYNIAREIFEAHDAILLGISVDNRPTLAVWTQQMGGLWFPVLSDFWPHGEAAARFGVLRSDGMTDRALFVIDKAGIIRYIGVGDINRRPNLKDLVEALEAVSPTR